MTGNIQNPLGRELRHRAEHRARASARRIDEHVASRAARSHGGAGIGRRGESATWNSTFASAVAHGVARGRDGRAALSPSTPTVLAAVSPAPE